MLSSQARFSTKQKLIAASIANIHNIHYTRQGTTYTLISVALNRQSSIPPVAASKMDAIYSSVSERVELGSI